MNKNVLEFFKYVLNPVSQKPENLGFGYWNDKTKKWVLEEKERKKFNTKYKRLYFINYIFWGLFFSTLFGLLIGLLIEHWVK